MAPIIFLVPKRSIAQAFELPRCASRAKPTSRSTPQNAAAAASPMSGARPGLEGGVGEEGACTRAHR